MIRKLSMASPKHLLLMRHAEVDLKWRGKFLGASDPALSEQGLDQARWWRRELAAVYMDRIVSSSQKRAMQTAQIIADGQSCPLEAVPALREVNLGLWEGLPPSQAREQFPEEFALRGHDLAGFPPPQGESLSDLARRVLPVWRELCQAEEKRLLLVAHAGVLRVILCHTLGMDLNRALCWRLDHGSLSLLKYHGARFTLLACNLLPHRTSLTVKYLE